ncbi:MAG: response regulator [Pseudomonadota bacterium]
MDTTDPLAAHLPPPTAARPLLGLTVLVVEDSRFACEALRLLCLRSGARIRRADCLKSARRHLQVYRPTVLIVDLGLPDGSGLELIDELTDAQSRVEALIAMSGDTHLEAAAIAAGADGFLAKPITSIAAFQDRVLTLLPAERRPKGPRTIDTTEVTPDILAYQDDIAHVAGLLESGHNGRTLDYIAQFIGGVAKSAADVPLEKAALALAKRLAQGETTLSETALIADMIKTRLSRPMAI